MNPKSNWWFLRVICIFWKSFVVVLAPIVLLPIIIVYEGEAARCGYVMLIIASYWVTEALPLSATAFIPVFAFPLLGIIDTGTISLVYMKQTNMLFMGGLIMAVAIEHCNLHRRIALSVILNVGQSTGKLLGGFMITTMLLSMWISNAAATAMMVPIMDAILKELNKTSNATTNGKSTSLSVESGAPKETTFTNDSYEVDIDDEKNETTRKNGDSSGKSVSEEATFQIDEKNMKNMYFLATAYAANIGGTGSPTGSGANVVTKALFENTFTDPTSLTYASWILFNIPGMLVCVFLAWVWLQVYFLGFGFWNKSIGKRKEKIIKNLIEREYKLLGPMSFHESVVLTLFVLLVGLWMLRAPGFMTGWVYFFELWLGPDTGIKDASTAWLVIILLFMIPAKPTFWPLSKLKDPNKLTSSEGCLTWEVVHEKMPWGVVFLLGGGFALAEASKESGLSVIMGEQLRGLGDLNPALAVFLVSLMTAMFTELASNTATASILMPVLKNMSLGACINPLYMIVPATACCCYAFMLPVATPPNALVHGMTNMKTTTMIKAGIGMNIVCVLVINVMINTLGVFMYDVHNMPAWANSTTGDVRCLNESRFAL